MANQQRMKRERHNAVEMMAVFEITGGAGAVRVGFTCWVM